eukprot:m.92138 g.92138  ORF g.92138 m.92138 type:complete len:707 (-) comp12350_c2_seq1:106-2226(-)
MGEADPLLLEEKPAINSGDTQTHIDAEKERLENKTTEELLEEIGLTRSERKASLIVLGFFWFFSGVEYAVILPTIWAFLQSLGMYESWFLGLSISAFSIASMVSSPLFGLFADTGGVKRLVLASCIFMVAGNFVYFIANDAYCILQARFLCGFGSGAAAASFAYLARASTIKERTTVVGSIVASRQFGILIGPALNFAFEGISIKMNPFIFDNLSSPGFIMTILWVFCGIFAMIWFKDMKPPSQHLDEDEGDARSRSKSNHSRTRAMSHRRWQSMSKRMEGSNPTNANPVVTSDDVSLLFHKEEMDEEEREEREEAKKEHIPLLMRQTSRHAFGSTLTTSITLSTASDGSSNANVNVHGKNQPKPNSIAKMMASGKKFASTNVEADNADVFSHHSITGNIITIDDERARSVSAFFANRDEDGHGGDLDVKYETTHIYRGFLPPSSDKQKHNAQASYQGGEEMTNNNDDDNENDYDIESTLIRVDPGTKRSHYGGVGDTPPMAVNKYMTRKQEFLQWHLLVLFAVQFLCNFNQVALETWVTPFTQEYFDWHENRNSVMYIIFGAIAVISFICVRLSSTYLHWKDRFIIFFGIMCQILGLLLAIILLNIAKPHTTLALIAFFVCCTLIVFGLPFLFIPVPALLSKLTRERNQGFGQGLRRTVASFATILGPLWAGAMSSKISSFVGVMIVLVCVAAFTMLVKYRKFNV